MAKLNSLKIILVLPLIFALAGCEGYRSINSTAALSDGAGIDVADINIQNVEMLNTEQRAGQRRLAQKMAQELSRRFIGDSSAPFKVHIVLRENERSLASRRDATVSRWMYFLGGTATVTHEGKQIARISSTADAPYFVETSPLATEANKKQAQEAAASVLTRDIHRQLNILLHEYSSKGR